MTDPPRPTIRCLFEDLADSVTDPRQRSALCAGQLPDLGIRLHDIDHPIVAAARDRYTDGEPRSRDRFRSVRDHSWVECRHGERWRGLVLWHPEDQRWLCFAGWHEAGSPTDVYEQFTKQCTAGSTTDSSRFLPGADDKSRLIGEQRLLERVARRQRFNRYVIECLLSAVTTPGEQSSVELPDGSLLRATLRADGDIDELTLQVTIDWSGGEGAAVVENVKDAVPGIGTNEWDVLAPGPTNLDPTYYVFVDTAWVERLLAAAAEHGLDVLGTNPNLALDPADGAAHIVPGRAEAAAAYVDGEPIRALCGRRFVPTSDPDAAASCPDCAEAHRKLQGDRTPPS